MGLGPAEAAVAAYFASRKQIRISASAFRLCASNTAAAGAGRIQSLRAFRRAHRKIIDMVILSRMH